MSKRFAIAAASVLALSGPALADSAGFEAPPAELAPYLQCVPYARERSGVQIFGDAHTWWEQAEGRYRRGTTPRPGAVMAFRPQGAMQLGHVAAVARVIDSRTVLLDHANWSPIDGRRGQIEQGAKAVDVSAANDWSVVRVWYDPLQALGTTEWPVTGFIYNEREDGRRAVQVRPVHAVPAAAVQPVSPLPSNSFMQAFAALGEPAAKTVAARAANGAKTAAPRIDNTMGEAAGEQTAQRRVEPRRPAVRGRPMTQSAPDPSDPVGRAIALYDR